MTDVTIVISETEAAHTLRLLAKYIDNPRVPQKDADAFYSLSQAIIEGINTNKLRERIAEITAHQQQ